MEGPFETAGPCEMAGPFETTSSCGWGNGTLTEVLHQEKQRLVKIKISVDRVKNDTPITSKPILPPCHSFYLSMERHHHQIHQIHQINLRPPEGQFPQRPAFLLKYV